MAEHQPQTTVITIAHNAERTIGQTIDSVLGQSRGDFEYLLVNNCSTDQTLDILMDYGHKDKRIRIINEPQKGIMQARNAGLKAARGEWIAVLDADDMALCDRLKCQWEYARSHPEVLLLGSGCHMIDGLGTILKTHHYPEDHENLVRRLEEKKAFFPQSSAFYKKDAVERVGGYRHSYAEDYDLWLRLSMEGRMACLDRPLIRLRRTVRSNSYNVSEETYLLFIVVSLVGYLRRKRGLTDLFSVSERRENFLSWTKSRMIELRCFEKGKASRELGRIWFSSKNRGMALGRIFWKCLSDSSFRTFLSDRAFLPKASQKIAQDSFLKFNF